MNRTARLGLAAVIVCAAGVPAAEAQQVPAAGPGRIEASIGGLWIGRQPLGSADANETTPTGGALKIFTTSSELATIVGLEGRVAVRLRPSLEAEVQGSYGAPQLKVAISGDSEAAAAVTAVENVQQFTIGGGVVWYVPSRWWGSRLVPFVTGGVGQLRQMHQDRVRLDTGRYLQVGGGVKAFFFSRPRGFVNALGARVDLRALVRTDGVAFDDRGHASPSVGVSAFVRF
jgi:hypothetical protein